VNRCLRGETASNTVVVLLLKCPPTNQIVFCWQSVSKKPPNKHGNLERNVLQPHHMRSALLHERLRRRKILIGPFDRVTFDRIKSPSPPVKNSVLQNKVRKQSRTLCDGLLHTQAPPSTVHPLSAISLTDVHLSRIRSKRRGNCNFKGVPPTQLSSQKYVLLPPRTTLRTLSSNQLSTPIPTPPRIPDNIFHHIELSLPPSFSRPPSSPYLAFKTTINPPCQPTSVSTIFLIGQH